MVWPIEFGKAEAVPYPLRTTRARNRSCSNIKRRETMSKTMSKIKHLLVSLLFTKLGDADFVSFCRTVATRLPGNPAFPAPPVDPTVFKTAVDTLATTLSEAQDGGRKAIAEKNKQR